MITKSAMIRLGTMLIAMVPASQAYAQARTQISIVGSSTVYPFASKVAERFGQQGKFKTPKVESTGTGGGLKLFCAGVGPAHPDIADASRRIKASEVAQCKKAGVTKIAEIKIGYDGIVLAHSKKRPPFALTLAQIYRALAAQLPDGTKNTVSSWNQVDPKLPNQPIEVIGPPPTSGTRDTFNELVMEGGCVAATPAMAELKKTDEPKFKKLCGSIREDGKYIQAGENDNLVVQKIEANPNAIGVFGYSYLEQNADKISGSPINGFAPTYDNIASGKYPISRPLFFYVKKAHLPVIPGLAAYAASWASDTVWGPDGYLAEIGLIALPDAARKVSAAAAKNLPDLDLASIK